MLQRGPVQCARAVANAGVGVATAAALPHPQFVENFGPLTRSSCAANHDLIRSIGKDATKDAHFFGMHQQCQDKNLHVCTPDELRDSEVLLLEAPGCFGEHGGRQVPSNHS